MNSGLSVNKSEMRKFTWTVRAPADDSSIRMSSGWIHTTRRSSQVAMELPSLVQTPGIARGFDQRFRRVPPIPQQVVKRRFGITRRHTPVPLRAARGSW